MERWVDHVGKYHESMALYALLAVKNMRYLPSRLNALMLWSISRSGMKDVIHISTRYLLDISCNYKG